VREQARLDAEERREERRLSLRMLAAAEAAGHAAITALFRGRRIHRSPDRCKTQASGQDILKNPEVAILNPECRAPSVKGVPRQLNVRHDQPGLAVHLRRRPARRSAEFLGEPDEKAFGAADVAEPIRVFVLDHVAADELRAVLSEPGERLVDVVTANMTRR
jgi:hypothetical protein